jgi:hypothetical protein
MNKAFTSSSILMLTCSERPLLIAYTQPHAWGSRWCVLSAAPHATYGARGLQWPLRRPCCKSASDGAEESVRARIRLRVAVMPNNLISRRICVASAGTAVGTPAGATGGIQEKKDPAVWENRNQNRQVIGN